jgi:hypothetical protein
MKKTSPPKKALQRYVMALLAQGVRVGLEVLGINY